MNRIYTILFVYACALVFPLFSYADLGPKASMNIEVFRNGNFVTGTIYSKVLSCQTEEQAVSSIREEESRSRSNDYYFPEELKIKEFDQWRKCFWAPSYGSWGSECKGGQCNFGYYLPSIFKLAIYLPDTKETFISSATTRFNFNASFRADLKDGKIVLVNATSFFENDYVISFAKALGVTLALELIVGLLYLSLYKIPNKLRVSLFIVLGNIISLPAVWFGLRWITSLVPQYLDLDSQFLIALLVAEILVVIFESWFLHFTNRDSLASKQSLGLSIRMNIVSLLVGSFLTLGLSFF